MLTLPDDDKSKHLKTTVLDQITSTKLTAEDGLSELIKILEKLLGKDDLEDCIIKYDDFEDYSHSVESITDYINQFDSKYTKVKNKGITLPSSVLAFKLLRNSNISNSERKIVLTGMDYEKKDTLYDQAKASLKKYCGEGGSGTLNSTGVMPGIKQETFMTSDMASCDPGMSSGRQDTFVTSRGRGCGQQKFWPHQYFPSNSSNRNWRGGSNNSSYNDWRSSGARGGFTQFRKTGGERPVNPLGLDGKPLLCKGCGSFRHFISACPDSWEHLKRPRNVHVVTAGCDTYESYADTHNPHTASQDFYRQMNTCDNYDYEYSGEETYFPVNNTLVAGINQ